MPADRAAFGAFLRSRRDRLTPAGAGIAPFPGPRRVPGLRKEELAVLAGLSPASTASSSLRSPGTRRGPGKAAMPACAGVSRSRRDRRNAPRAARSAGTLPV